MIQYTLKRSRRAKYVRLAVRPGGTVILTAPHWFSAGAIERFIASKQAWLGDAIEKMRHLRMLPGGKREYGARREAARTFVTQRLEYWNTFYRFSFNRVSIKNTSSLWGSCSRKSNLNFSYKLVYLPRELADYVIVHELCHLQEHNHGAHFWALVARTLPQYARLRRELKKYVLRD